MLWPHYSTCRASRQQPTFDTQPRPMIDPVAFARIALALSRAGYVVAPGRLCCGRLLRHVIVARIRRATA